MSREGFSTSIWVSQELSVDCLFPTPPPTPTDSSLLMGRLGEVRGHFSGYSQQNWRNSQSRLGKRSCESHAPKRRGEWPQAKVRWVGSPLPGAGASSGRLLRKRRLPALETRSRLPGPHRRRAQPRWPRPQWLETPSLCSHLYTSCLHHRCPLPGPAYFFPVRTCDAGNPAHCLSPPRNPHFRFSRLLGNQASAVSVIAPFCRWPPWVRAGRRMRKLWYN